MTYEIKLTVRVMMEGSMTDAAKRVQDRLEEDNRATGIMVVSIDKVTKERSS